MSSAELPDLSAIRTEYATVGLSDEAALDDPFELFSKWFAEVASVGLLEPNAMEVATIGPDGSPTSRMVLLKVSSRAPSTSTPTWNQPRRAISWPTPAVRCCSPGIPCNGRCA